jgi:glucose/arabinose dehydrogenase
MRFRKPILLFVVISLGLIALLALLSVRSLGILEPPPARAVQVTWPQVELIRLVGGLDRPVYVTHAGDGSERLFIVEQSGRIRIYQNGSLLPAPLLDISGRVHSPDSGGGNEEGLLNVAFPPGYASKNYFYVYYTNKEGNNQVSRFHLQPGQSGVADADSEELILLLEHPRHSNHNGGQLAFGPDGYLYVGVGDGGGGGDPNGNGQNLGTLLGKILRIDVEAPSLRHSTFLACGETAGLSGEPYQVPADNPFVNTSGARPEIWAFGLRNPWRFSFDRLTHDLYIGDVGQNAIEEIDFQPAASKGGENYGWNILEGTRCYEPSSGCVSPEGSVAPVAEYAHQEGCSVTGGVVYRGELSELQGIYFYADFCSGRIWGLRNDGGWQSQELLASDRGISSFGEDEDGNMYVVDMYSGDILRLESQ